MTVIKPFKAIRPAKDKVHLVATRSVDRYKPAELNSKMAENPYTFFHVIKPEFGQAVKSRPNSPELLKKIKNKFTEFRKKETLIQDQKEGFYIYQQIADHHSYTGIIGCASIDDYFNEVIKIHEQTLTEREEKLKSYLEVCDFNAEPVCMMYPDNQTINAFVEKVTSHEPLYDFTTTDMLRHKVWPVHNLAEIKLIEAEFKKIPAIYIADGHHRSASSALLGKSMREKNKSHSGKEPFNFYMSIFFPESQLKIYDYNRVVKDLGGLSSVEFLKKIAEKFEVEEKPHQFKPKKLHNISLYLNKKWYSLTAKPEIIHNNDPVGSLDAAILSEHILGPILHIKDLKTDKRIAFVSGIKGMYELQQMVDSGKMQAAFALHPATMHQIKRIADTNCIMPPKTTWVEPKLRSGLIIYSLDKNDA